MEEFYKRDPGGDINRIYAEVIKDAPALKQAQAGLEQAQRDLDQAKLELSYCTITAEIDGVITRRNVNPGNNVQVGQSLMAIRSLRDIWVDANFKETQLRDLRIGQRVDLEVDMYGGKHSFEGRISGFTMGTGSTLALLPPQNATGNFVKVVQRLPVRIDLVNYDPDKLPLFVGLSVRPSVDLRSKPTGPNAGSFLQELTHLLSPPARRAPGDERDIISRSPGTGRRQSRGRSIRGSSRSRSSFPTFMEVLDTTIANVALRHMAGGLSAPVTDGEWVITSYLAANAIILPISGWLSVRLGRRNYFLLSIAVFTIASALCGMATSLNALIASRVLQGLAGGGLQPSSQGVLLDAFPREKQGTAMTVIRHRGIARTGRRPDARWLHHRQLRLALDLLSQRAGRAVRARHVSARS